MYQTNEMHPLSRELPPLDDATRNAMWKLFIQIGQFWMNMHDPSAFKSRVYSFVDNRISLDPLYREYYMTARDVIAQLVSEYGEQDGYRRLFTDSAGLISPPTTALAITRQKVSNELIALQLAVGGFKAFGAKNYCGYFGGPNLPDAPPPYRTIESGNGS
ncbi:MAG: hypothetical protein AB1810_14630 [Pseudomonadota bacterium]